MSSSVSPHHHRDPLLKAVDQGLATLEAAAHKSLGSPGTGNFTAAHRAIFLQASKLRSCLPPNGPERAVGLIATLLLRWLERADNLSESTGQYELFAGPEIRFQSILGSVEECSKLAAELRDTRKSLALHPDNTANAATENAATEKVQKQEASTATVLYDEFVHPIATVLFDGISQGRCHNRELRLRLGGAPRARSSDDGRYLDLLIENAWGDTKGWLPVRLHSKPTEEMKESIKMIQTTGKGKAAPPSPLKKRDANEFISTPRSSFSSNLRSGILYGNTLKRVGSKLKSVLSFEKKNESAFSVHRQSKRVSCSDRERDGRPLDENSWRIKDAKSHDQIYDHLKEVDPVFKTHLHHFELDGAKRWLLHKHDTEDKDGYEYEHSLGELASKMRWGENQRMAIFFHLAYALSCYYESRWLTGHWDPENISFFKHGSHIPCEPWLKLLPTTPLAKYKASDRIYHPQILELGVLSLELELGQPIAQFLNLATAADMHGRWGQASRVWAKSLKNGNLSIASGTYRQAIDFCLQEDHVKDPVVFRRMIWDQVVLPLRATLPDENMAKMDLAGVPEPTASQRVNADGTWTPFTVRRSIDTATSMYRNASRESAGPSIGKSTLYHTSLEYLSLPEKPILHAASVADSPPRIPNHAPTAADSGTALGPGRAALGQPSLPQDEPYKASKAWIENFKAVINGNQGGGASNTRVKVALLDTGIDTEHDFFQESCDDGEPRLNPRIKEICSWVDGNKGQRTTNGRDECGHGTSVANLLLDLCPNIDLYVARVSKTLEFESGAAANIKNNTWQVDIVNLSAGFPEPIGEIEAAIDEITGPSWPDKQVLVFAAASNSGPDEPRWFPASCHSVFGMHSTNADGDWSRFNADPKCDANFAILGEDIESAWLTSSGSTSATRRCCGTSYATAIAVSLAAFLFALVPAIVSSHKKCYYKVYRFQGMQTLLQELARQPEGQFRYLNLARYFSSSRNTIEGIGIKFGVLLNPRGKQQEDGGSTD
ncbi:Peptidase S8/S53, subtilisin/kexin/sedolisin [Cordyceps fumosorosea ARSEF 2679]|uniref:Peptidase S8/S53, subtilisin/kexin/sedolisin n=1 Tax=Cordyceps fumosorosea (strain ARSEF 2679) TaxID=1081104 RepID=A0A167NMB8_CORFA|nr:Peptidase S8/S53, subtilisin/kexin/sedolisin [Cordyceps fumosorosea ARSEF 2679]OAA55712.1 Peptidase S8/S53, subtilisin/kexin/sedolisin [Cordyceps fumosorosea ARSEF 2679]